MKSLKTVLQVEDDRNDVEFFNYSLQKERIECNLVVLRDGEEAIAYLRETNAGRALSPDLIFLDIKMPRVTGLEVLEWIQANSEHDQVVVVLSASPLKKD